MPHERSRWLARVRAVESESLAVGFSLEWLLGANPNENVHCLRTDGQVVLEDLAR
jgi:hypothetical protein